MSRLLRPLALVVVPLSLLLTGATPGFATLIGQELTVELLAPNDGNLQLQDTLIATGAGDLLPDDGSAIGELLLSTEFIQLGSGDGDQIVIGLEEGRADGRTGYSDPARYVISRLYSGLGMKITDVTLVATNITGATIAFDDHSVTVFLADLVIGEIPGIDSGLLTLDLTLMVPEPASAALVLFGLLGLVLRNRAVRS